MITKFSLLVVVEREEPVVAPSVCPDKTNSTKPSSSAGGKVDVTSNVAVNVSSETTNVRDGGV